MSDAVSNDMIPAERVAYACGASLDRVRMHWPTLYTALLSHGIADGWTQIAMIATVGVETAHQFAPISEFGVHPEYDVGRLARRLGNTPQADGDGELYEGRGFIQITGRANYRAYGKRLGLDLEANPRLALRPSTAAQIAALYFLDRKIPADAQAGDWRTVRKKVNGGYNGWEDFARILRNLGVVV